MDYEFLRDITGVVKVRMSMDHEAIGHWFNEEVKDNLALLDEVEQAARTVKGSERSWQRAGHEYTLWLDGEVMIRANQLEFSGDEIEEGMSYYDEESLSLCSIEDFLHHFWGLTNVQIRTKIQKVQMEQEGKGGSMFDEQWQFAVEVEREYAQYRKKVMMRYHLSAAEVDILLFLANNSQFDLATDIVCGKCRNHTFHWP